MKKVITHSIFAFIMLAVSSGAFSAEWALIVKNITSDKGTLFIAVFDSEANFQADEPVRAFSYKPEMGEMQVQISDLPAGTYAVMAYHDVNGNKELDTNLFGLPKEPWGGSLGGKQVFGPPQWKHTRFTISESNEPIEVALN